MANVVHETADLAGRVKGFFPAQHLNEYPWDQWLDGQVWQINTAAEINHPIDSFRGYCYLLGKRLGLKIQTKRLGPHLYLKATPLSAVLAQADARAADEAALATRLAAPPAPSAQPTPAPEGSDLQ